MQNTLELLKKSKVIKNYEILDFKQGKNFYFLKIKTKIVDNSELLRNYMSETEYLYSYHWQDKEKNMIVRWDNSPHHKQLKTFPHHKHAPDIKESKEIRLEDILKVIEKNIKL